MVKLNKAKGKRGDGRILIFPRLLLTRRGFRAAGVNDVFVLRRELNAAHIVMSEKVPPPQDNIAISAFRKEKGKTRKGRKTAR